MDGQDVTGQRIDPTRAYRQKLPSGRCIDLFFYDGPISRAVAFEGLLNNGEQLRAPLLDAFSDQRDWPQLAHIATDGETYGHHHAFGDMALAYALEHIESSGLAKITNYGEFLEQHPPEHDVEILENTAWSCVARRGPLEHELRLQLRRARRTGTRNGALRCARRSIGCATKSRPAMKRWPRVTSRIRGPRATTTFTSILDRSPESRERFAAANFRRKNLQRSDRVKDLEAARDAAPRHADVHQLRLVLRRAVGHRNGAGDPIRRARRATGRGAVRRRARAAFPREAGARQEQSAGALATAPRSTRNSSSPPAWILLEARRALRHELAVRELSRATPASTLTRWKARITA